MSATASSQVLTSVRTVGGLLPADMLIRIAEGRDVSGSRPADYHVVGARSVHDAAERHWDFLKGAWRVLRDKIGDTGHDPSGLAVENWLLPLFEEHGFGRLEPTPAGIASTDQTATFPVTHRWRHVLVHLAGWDADLDHRLPGGGLPPQSMLQECLNRSEEHLWGVLSNGRQLRLLRDSSALAGSAFIEFDLEAMFDGELFDEFVLLYRLLQVSRFEIPDDAALSACWLEKWRTEAIEAGARALDQLRDGVADAIAHLGTGLLRHPANGKLREDLDTDLFKRALLRLVYRLLFWFVAEDRDVLLHPDADPAARARYQKYYSAARLRASALRRIGTSHGDLWQAVRLIFGSLGDEDGLPRLGLAGLGGIYDDTGTDQILRGLELANEHLLAAVKSLARVYDRSARRWRRVDYQNLGAEELGSIYESLLELVPKWSKEERKFLLDVMPGNERKSTGSYYTPTSLIDCLLDSTLDPVLDDAQKQAEVAATRAGADASAAIAETLLTVTVCDPACGSGHFLVAAARRIAKRLAAVRERNPEPTIEALRTALRDVVTCCIYGVDVNPMAVELAKVSLWLEALEPGKPLGFLDAHIKCGNALIGAMPALIDGGIPDKAFKSIEGDDAQWAASLGRANANDDPNQDELISDRFIFSQSNEHLAKQLARISDAPDGSLHDVHRQAAAYHAWKRSPENKHLHEVADAWCAAFVWRKTKDAPPAIVNRVFRALRKQGSAAIPPATATEIARLKSDFGFFHWHLEFPDIFRVPDSPDPGVDTAIGWSGGFTCLLGNPPWDKVDFEDKKYFSTVEPSIAALAGQARRDRIISWQRENPEQAVRYRATRRKIKATFLFASSSETFPLCAKGLTVKGVNSLQTDQLFAERFMTIAAPAGRLGCIVPTAIASGAGGQYLFGNFTNRGAVASLYDFENRKPLFVGVDSRQKFCLLSLVGKAMREHIAKYAFFLLDTPDLDDAGRVFALSLAEIALINPNTGTLPIFRSRRDASLTAAIHRRIPVLWDETKADGNPWDISFMRVFDMPTDSDLCRTRSALEADGWHLHGNVFTCDGQRMLPLYEAKMIDFYNHRAADVIKSETAVNRQNQPRYLTMVELQDPTRCAMPLQWIADDGLIPTRRNGRDVEIRGVSKRLAEAKWDREWLCGWCDVTSSTNERTAIPAFLPRTAVTYTFRLMFPRAFPELIASLMATQSSLVFDYVSRQKVGGLHMNGFIWKQLPVPTPATLEPHTDFLSPRVLELVYTAYDMTSLARDLGDDGGPFRWDEERRFPIRAELDAFCFRLYGIERDDVDYIMETFQTETGGLKHNDIAKYGSYRTKETILEFYDRMAAADATGLQYATPIMPPPGHGPRHLARNDM
jgi:Eco57I restriction-modification methylase